VGEPCSRHRREGVQCVIPSTLRRAQGSGQAPRVCAPPESANRAVDPKGHTTANMVLGPFAKTKRPRSPGRNPATHNKASTWLMRWRECWRQMGHLQRLFKKSPSCVLVKFRCSRPASMLRARMLLRPCLMDFFEPTRVSDIQRDCGPFLPLEDSLLHYFL